MYRGFAIRSCMPICIGSFLFFAPPIHAADVVGGKRIRQLEISGEIVGGDDISGIALRDDLLVLVSDEGRSIQVLKREAGGGYRASESHVRSLSDGPGDTEIDLEGVAWGQRYVYAIGSHSRKRKSVSADKRSAKNNRDRLFQIVDEPSRDQFFRFVIGDDGTIDQSSIKSLSLRGVLANHPILELFQAIPGKENGIDIEGVAVGDGDKVYIGFRGPVLRGGYALVLVATIDESKSGALSVEVKEKKGLRLLNLGGRGVRDIARLPSPGDELYFLVLAGPVGDGPASYIVYQWDGRDTVPGTDKPYAHKHLTPLCELPMSNNLSEASGKPEGIAVLKASDDSVEFIVVHDGVMNGAPTLFSCPLS